MKTIKIPTRFYDKKATVYAVGDDYLYADSSLTHKLTVEELLTLMSANNVCVNAGVVNVPILGVSVFSVGEVECARVVFAAGVSDTAGPLYSIRYTSEYTP